MQDFQKYPLPKNESRVSMLKNIGVDFYVKSFIFSLLTSLEQQATWS